MKKVYTLKLPWSAVYQAQVTFHHLKIQSVQVALFWKLICLYLPLLCLTSCIIWFFSVCSVCTQTYNMKVRNNVHAKPKTECGLQFTIMVQADTYNNQMISIHGFPSSALLSLIRKRSGVSGDIPLVVQDTAKAPGTSYTSTKCALCGYLR